MYCRFDNANQKKYKIKKRSKYEIQFKDSELIIKPIILRVYIYYLNFIFLFFDIQLFQKFMFKFY